MGGRQARQHPIHGHIYDHFAIEFEYPDGVRMFSQCRQMHGIEGRVGEGFAGTKGTAWLGDGNNMILPKGGRVFRTRSSEDTNPYHQEHEDLIASIRAGKPLNAARAVAESTLVGIMGREAAYTGQTIEWDDALNSNTRLGPEKYELGPLPSRLFRSQASTGLSNGGLSDTSGRACAPPLLTEPFGILYSAKSIAMNAPDLTQRPPRSPRVRLGGYVILPRMLDKGRATVAGKNGEYHFACPLDQRFLEFVGLDPESLKKELAAGKGDGEILAWIKSNARYKRDDAEVSRWSVWQQDRAPSDVESRDFVQKLHAKIAPEREDIATWFDLLDLDDYVSFGGAP